MAISAGFESGGGYYFGWLELFGGVVCTSSPVKGDYSIVGCLLGNNGETRL